ncbi:unnamed protein product [Ilex paraguariensis]|uniref:Uncharacterized protein n=1 Tax=Ilex paraguariensis TaxID=185542 RepID=A0ABC8RMV4_9AQUA
MEELRSVVPDTLKQRIGLSTPGDLHMSCSLLLHFFRQLPQFHQFGRELRDPETALFRKNNDSALELKRQGNDCFSKRDYPDALRFYSQALRLAPSDDADCMEKNLVATLYLNRATVFHKMGLQVECLRDCDRALVISPSYAKAWYRRGKANAASLNQEDAVRDLTIAMNMQLSSGGKEKIESELKLIIGQQKGSSSSLYKTYENRSSVTNEPQIKLQCVRTPAKGRGVASLNDIPQASLVHTEQPYAAKQVGIQWSRLGRLQIEAITTISLYVGMPM